MESGVVCKVAWETIVEDAECEQIARTWLSSNGTGNRSTAPIVSTFTRTFAAAEEHKMQGFGKQSYGIHPETTYTTIVENTGK